MARDTVPDPLAVAAAHFAAVGGPAYVVGGRVRDRLLGRSPSDADTDIAVVDSGLEHARAIARAGGGAFVALDPERDVGRVVWPASGQPRATLDVAALTGPTLGADLAARDFTVNALAVPLDAAWRDGEAPPAAWRAALVDPTGGLADLAARRLRMTGAAALDADPLRLMRAPRLAGELGFAVDDATAAAIRARAPSIRRVAGERVRDELLRLLACPGPARRVIDLDALGLLEAVLPEVAAGRGVAQSPPHDRDVLDHTLGVVAATERFQALVGGSDPPPDDPATPLVTPAEWDAVVAARRGAIADHVQRAAPAGGDADVWRRFAALVHDIGKPVTRAHDAHSDRIRFPEHDRVGSEMAAAIAHRLRLSAAEEAFLTSVVRHHMRPLYLALDDQLSDRAVYRYFDATGAAGVDVVLLSLADNAAKAPRASEETARLAHVAARLLDAWFVDHARLVAPPPLIRGDALMAALDLPAGPEVGRLLAAIREAQAAGEVVDAAGALALARRRLEEGG